MGKTLSPDQLKVWTDRLEAGVSELHDSQRYADYLSAMSKFHRYSYGNIILILQQCPHAQQVAGYHKWKNTFGRQVKRYETGITILAPCKYKCQVKAETAGGDEEPVQDTAVVEKCRFLCEPEIPEPPPTMRTSSGVFGRNTQSSMALYYLRT